MEIPNSEKRSYYTQKKEPLSDVDMSITAVYKTIWTICKLKREKLKP
jgi:hypothetical protein